MSNEQGHRNATVSAWEDIAHRFVEARRAGRSLPDFPGEIPPDLVSAYQVDDGVPLLQVKVSAKGNELVVAPQILARLDLQGVLVTGDAMFAQRNLSSQIVEAGGDYCWIVKENQPTLFDDLRLLFGPQPEELPGTSPIPDDFVTVRTVDKAHGRLEERVLTSSSLLAEYQGWPYVKRHHSL